MSRYAIWQATGLDQGLMSRFMSGKSRLTTESVDKLVDVLGLTLTPRKRRGASRVEIDRPS
jgi:hypothetical protein